MVAMKGAARLCAKSCLPHVQPCCRQYYGRDGSPWPVRLTEVQDAQKAIINVARRLSDGGAMVLAAAAMILSDPG